MFTLLEAGVKPRWAGCKQPYQVLVWLIKSVGASGAVVQFPRGRAKFKLSTPHRQIFGVRSKGMQVDEINLR
jgi:hypothetical protein